MAAETIWAKDEAMDNDSFDKKFREAKIIEAIIDSLQANFNGSGLSYSVFHRVINKTDEMYSTEVAIDVLDSTDNIVDAYEFFVFRAGRLLLDVQEVRALIEEEAKDTIQKYGVVTWDSGA